MGIQLAAGCMRALSFDACALPAVGSNASARASAANLTPGAAALPRRPAAAAKPCGLPDRGCCMSTSFPSDRGDMPCRPSLCSLMPDAPACIMHALALRSQPATGDHGCICHGLHTVCYACICWLRVLQRLQARPTRCPPEAPTAPLLRVSLHGLRLEQPAGALLVAHGAHAVLHSCGKAGIADSSSKVALYMYSNLLSCCCSSSDTTSACSEVQGGNKYDNF